jgi:hypothetical protein
VTDYLTIDFNGLPGLKVVSVVSSSGIELRKESTAADQLRIDFSDLPAGIYVIKLAAGKELFNFNIIRQ